MKRFNLIIFLVAYSVTICFSQINPVKAYGKLFTEVQLKGVFEDSKTFPDCIPIKSPESIMRDYESLKIQSDFNLKTFILQRFFLPPDIGASFQTNRSNTLVEHINILWGILERSPDTVKNTSLIPLPYSYIVPGGRFREIYYWDSYFTMLGLWESGEGELAENMVKNFAFLLDEYGRIPNGNRTYYLSRSQPPFFSLMVTLLAEKNGMQVYKQFLPQLIKEYAFWMEGTDQLENKDGHRRVVKMPDGEILNRYWDDNAAPRPESFKEDVLLAEKSDRPKEDVYRNIRAACESGWDFSSRWLEDPSKLESIRTTEIVPVDLNCLMYHLEKALAKAFFISGDSVKEKIMEQQALRRKRNILKYFWNQKERFYCDYDLKNQTVLPHLTLAGVYPLFFELVSPKNAKNVSTVINKRFLSDGGMVTSLTNSKQQWDYPNGWPPLQYITISGLARYGLDGLAITIKERWIKLNQQVFFKTGKMMEKYNVRDLNLEAGGGEYKSQDGFGWTNGVYLKLLTTGN